MDDFNISTSKIVAVGVIFVVIITIIAGCNIAVSAFQPNVQPAPVYGEIDD